MSAFGTMKPGGQEAVQLTFPAVFSQTYAKDRLPLSFVGRSGAPTVQPMAGTDFQSRYHEQKKADADRMAMAKVTATRNMKTRAFSSHQGYFGMPSPVLAQRRFANPSYGAQIIESARRDGSVRAPWTLVEEGSMSGGVLRTAEGQAFGKARLLDRVRQLNAIEVAKQAFKELIPQSEAPQIEPLSKYQEYQPSGSDDAIELSLLLQGIINSTVEGDYTKLSSISFFDNGLRVLKLLFRWAVNATPDEIEDKLAMVENIYQNLGALLDPDRLDQIVGEARDDGRDFARIVGSSAALFEMVRDYMTEMLDFISSATRTLDQKVAKSKALVKQLQFARFFTPNFIGNPREVENPDIRDTFENFDEGDTDGHFDERAGTREDDEARSRSVGDFNRDERQSFGYDSGVFFGEAPGGGAGEAPNVYTRGTVASEQPEEDRATVPSLSISQPTIRRTVSEETGLPDVAVVRPAAPEAAPAPRAALPAPRAAGQRLRRDELPRTREGLVDLAGRINAAGGIREDGTIGEGGTPIRIYASAKPENILRNFIRRLRL